VEEVLTKGGEQVSEGLARVLATVETMLSTLANSVLQEQPPLRRKKIESLIIEYVHKRATLRALIKSGVDNNRDFEWLCQMRFYFDPKQTDVLQQLSIHMANARCVRTCSYSIWYSSHFIFIWSVWSFYLPLQNQ
jgi:dynein heavy chain 1